MTTLIATYNSEGCTGHCDAKCYGASTAECTCLCGGMNHGKGRQKAEANTRALAETWIEKWKEQHPDTQYFNMPAAQLALPLG